MSEIKNEVEKTNEEVKDLASTVKDETAAAEVTTEDKAAKEEEVKAAEQTAEKTDTEKKSGPDLEPFNCRIIVVTSGKGGVGKTTSSAAIATGLALKGH